MKKDTSTKKPSTTPTSTRFWDDTFDFYRTLAATNGEDANMLMKLGANIGGLFLALQGRFNPNTGCYGTLPPEVYLKRLESWVVLGARELESNGISINTLPPAQAATLVTAVAEAVVTRLAGQGNVQVVAASFENAGYPVAMTTLSSSQEGFALDEGMDALLGGAGFIELTGNKTAS